MIPLETLLKEINEFKENFDKLNEECDKATKGGEEHLQWYKMHKAYVDLQNVVEFKLKPFND